MNTPYKHILNPENLLIEDRDVLDLIIFIKEYSKLILFYNKENKVDGTWYDLLRSEETFLIAEISKFKVSNYSVKRLNFIKDYDQAFGIEDKKHSFHNFFDLCKSLFEKIDFWYTEALKNNLTQASSIIEVELEIYIKNKLSPLLQEFIDLATLFGNKNIINRGQIEGFDKFNSIWNITLPTPIPSNPENDIVDETDLNFALKRITLIFNPTYEIIYDLVLKCEDLYKISLYNNDNHKAHTGLIFAFLELFKYPVADLNTFTKKHLDFYFRNLLKLKPRTAQPNKIYISVEIDENLDGINIKKDTLLNVGQRENGEEILFQTNVDFKANNINLAHISTFYLSESKFFDHHSRFNLISGLYSKIHASNSSEVEDFNNNVSTFSSLGEEQLFLSSEDQNMDKAEIGFLISSPVLKLSKSNRTIDLDLKFTVDSIKILSDLILDISHNKDVSEVVTFNEIFSNAFIIHYTSIDSWTRVEGYKVTFPFDWSTGKITLTMELNKAYPAIVALDNNIHDLDIDSKHPVLKVELNQESFYNPYSFLNSMELSKIDINVNVKNLKQFNCFVNKDRIDINSDFELFGAIPNVKSSLIIASDELFNKKVKSVGIEWDYTNLSVVRPSFKEFYKEYDRNIDYKSFVTKVDGLSDFEYTNHNNQDYKFELFNTDENGKLLDKFKIEDLDFRSLKIKPNYNLELEALDDYSNDLETGYLKFELEKPSFGFGFDIYGKVLNDITQKTINQKPKKGSVEILNFPNEPFSPKIANLTLSYKAKSTLIFNQRKYSENDFDEQNSFYLISPFGIQPILSKFGINENNLVKNFKYQGELILGFENTTQPLNLNLLFEILKSDNPNYEFSRKIDWFYSTAEGWKMLTKTNIIYDDTLNLMKTGVLSFKIPEDISNKSRIYNTDKLFIKACSKSKSNHFSLIKSIRTNSVSLTEIIDEQNVNNLPSYYPPYSVQGFKEDIDGVISVDQHFGSAEGESGESDIDFYLRSSELLRHKNRPVTKWDLEKFIIANFSWISHVKCFPVNSNNITESLKVLCVKKVKLQENIDNIRLSAAEKQEIVDYLRQFSSPFSSIEIINPVFEDIWLKCKVNFKNVADGIGIRMLNNDLYDFFCLWLYDDTKPMKLGVQIKKIDIINFVKERPYISYVTSISIIHVKTSEKGGKIAVDSANKNINTDFIKPGLPWVILTPNSHNHIIDILETNEYHPPEPVSFNNLGLESAFLISSDLDDQIQLSDSKSDLEEDDTEYNFKLKI
ncbi:hypothetical protein [Psychroflexus planctonicus]|uniref:Baseplate J-like protein n=1 Tax=Psychroflexus planctonicus TaxID=1526575 RepID=A0ABQ1SLU1_9FLAO|nr:hypothetical protein [Psychroflexus planctonicus]GGE41034.1 hypothetical protein GCM10010832_21390 [Psychroflexus planctonicus]